jgi:hypothetical protein
VFGKLLIGLSVLALGVGATSCKRLSEPPPDVRGRIQSAPAPYVDAVPLEYGRLVAVTTGGNLWAALWFEKTDKTIVVVPVNWPEGKMGDTVGVIPRK